MAALDSVQMCEVEVMAVKKEERNEEILRLYNLGYTDDGLSARFGVSHARIWKIVQKTREEKRKKIQKKTIVQFLKEGKSVEEVHTEMGISKDTIRFVKASLIDTSVVA